MVRAVTGRVGYRGKATALRNAQIPPFTVARRLTYLLAQTTIRGECDRPRAVGHGKANMESERRTAPRYPFFADADVTEIASDSTLPAKTSDLSLSGCFLDIPFSPSEGAEIRVRISHKNMTFTTLGKIAYVMPKMGMGVTFTSFEDEQLAILQEWISEFWNARR